MDRRIAAIELRIDLDGMLDVIRQRGDRFVIEVDGVAVATMRPVAHHAFTFEDVIEVLRSGSRADARFADDVEAMQREQPDTGLGGTFIEPPRG